VLGGRRVRHHTTGWGGHTDPQHVGKTDQMIVATPSSTAALSQVAARVVVSVGSSGGCLGCLVPLVPAVNGLTLDALRPAGMIEPGGHA